MGYYDDIAKGYDELYGEEQITKLKAIQKALSDNIFIGKGTKVLDVGCGTGISSDFFVKEYSADVQGVDPALKLLNQNKNQLSQLAIGNAERLLFEAQSFDVVVSISAIQNFTDVHDGLCEIKRVGKGNYILSFMSRGKNANIIDKTIREVFEVRESFTVLNDTVYLIY